MKVASIHSKGERNMSMNIIRLNEEAVKGELNERLDKEAEAFTGAARYERNEARQGYCSGHYSRNLSTTSEKVVLNMPKLKVVTFETAHADKFNSSAEMLPTPKVG